MISSNMFLLNIVYGMFGVLSPVEVSDSARESVLGSVTTHGDQSWCVLDLTLHLGCVYNTTVSKPLPFFGPEGHESMGSDRVVGPLFVHPLCGYGAKRLCSRSPAYPCPPGPLYGPGTWSFVSSHGVDGYHRPAPK